MSRILPFQVNLPGMIQTTGEPKKAFATGQAQIKRVFTEMYERQGFELPSANGWTHQSLVHHDIQNCHKPQQMLPLCADTCAWGGSRNHVSSALNSLCIWVWRSTSRRAVSIAIRRCPVPCKGGSQPHAQTTGVSTPAKPSACPMIIANQQQQPSRLAAQCKSQHPKILPLQHFKAKRAGQKAKQMLAGHQIIGSFPLLSNDKQQTINKTISLARMHALHAQFAIMPSTTANSLAHQNR